MAYTLVDLVLGDGEGLHDGMEALVGDHPGLLAQVEREVGPGGWPEVRVSGSVDQLVAFLVDYHGHRDGPWVRGLIHA